MSDSVVLDSEGFIHPQLNAWNVLKGMQFAGWEVNASGFYLTFDSDWGPGKKFGPVDLSCCVLPFDKSDYR